MRFKQVVVIGSGDETSYINESYEIGRFIAKNNCILISGGRGGIMEKVSKGASEEGGIVLGILPGPDFDAANEYCNIVIPTGIGYARNIINVLSGDVIIAIGGKSGTLSELAYAWQYKKPVILCAFAEGWSKRLSGSTIDDRTGRFFIAEKLEDVYRYLIEILDL